MSKKKTTKTEGEPDSSWAWADIQEILFPVGGALAGMMMLADPAVPYVSTPVGLLAISASLEHLYGDIKEDSPVIKVGGDWVDRRLQHAFDMSPIPQSDATAAALLGLGLLGGAKPIHFLGCFILALGEALTGSLGQIGAEK